MLSILYIQTSIKIINRILRLSELFQQYYKVTNMFVTKVMIEVFLLDLR